jgi:RNA polymerase sigma-70 factor (ECF subfamily)
MVKRTNDQWLADLRSVGDAHEQALTDLREMVLNGLPAALPDGTFDRAQQYAALVEEIAQETVLRVVGSLDTFEGRSQFSTWVYKIAVRLAFTELRRRRWKDISLESLQEPETGTRGGEFAGSARDDPERRATRSDFLDRLYRMMKEELSDRQMLAMRLVAIHQMPLEEAARRLGSKRNALYKLLHDARLRMKHRLEREGLEVQEILSVFEES